MKAVKFITYVVLPVAAVILLMSFNALLALLVAAVYTGWLLYSRRASIYSVLGNMAYGRGDPAGALQLFKRAYDTGGAKDRVKVSYAYLLLKNGNVETAENILEKVVDKSSDNDGKMYAKSNLALVLWKKGEVDSAIAMLEEVMNGYVNSTVYGSLGFLLIVKGDLGKALKFNLEAYEYNSSNAVILDNLGQTYFLLGEYEKAEEIYKKLMESNPSFPEAYFNYGLLLKKTGKPEEALRYMEKSLDYKLTFLSTITTEEIESEISSLKNTSEES